MVYKYGEFSNEQIRQTKEYIRKQIYFLLLCVDPDTKNQYQNINVEEAFNNLLFKIGGFNSLLNYAPEIVTVSSLLCSALDEFRKEDFSFSIYRKLILDAGSEILKIKEV